MFSRSVPLFLAVLCILTGLAYGDEEAKKENLARFTEGKTLLKEGDIDGALKAFSAAAKGAPRNKTYTEQVVLLRRVISLKKIVETKKDSPNWEKAALALHAFYLSNGLLKEALVLDKQMHLKLNSANSASLLAETLLKMNKNKEAAVLLQGLQERQLNTQNQIYLGISLARIDKKVDARTIRDKITLPAKQDPGFLYDVARLN